MTRIDQRIEEMGNQNVHGIFYEAFYLRSELYAFNELIAETFPPVSSRTEMARIQIQSMLLSFRARVRTLIAFNGSILPRNDEVLMMKCDNVKVLRDLETDIVAENNRHNPELPRQGDNS